MKQIPLTKGFTVSVDDEDYEYLSKFKWSALPSRGTNDYYAARKASVSEGYGPNKRILMHREILGITREEKCQVDHVNRNTLDNRRANIRRATASQNMANRGFPSNQKSGLRGIRSANSGMWRARIRVNRKEIHLGTFPTKEAAYATFLAAHKAHFGEFSAL